MEIIICPMCGKECKDLLAHIKIHKDYKIYNKHDLYRYFPNYTGKFRIENCKIQHCECEICGKEFNRKNDLVNHARLYHQEYYEKIKQKDDRKCANYTCPICGKKFNCIKQHIERKHKISWDEFCETYNWDKSKTNCITEEYRKKLSENKKKFYRTTERGKELRKEQSIKYSENNPASDRKKIEKIIFTRSIHNNIPQKGSHGIKVFYDGNTFRSFNEFEFYALCKHFNINLEYEPIKYVVKYFNAEKNFMTTYLPDFYIDTIGLLELKDTERTIRLQKNDEKYLKVSKIYSSKNINFNMLALESALKLVGINLLNFERIDILMKIINEAIENKNIHFLCSRNSRKIQLYTKENFNNPEIVKFTK